MAIQIGSKTESSFMNPIGLLSDCHRRIKRFLMVLITIIRQSHGGILGEDQQNALKTALRYFHEAAPKHTLDEEDSLFPRIRAVGNLLDFTERESLDHLEEEHVVMELNHHQIEALGQKWLLQGQLSMEDSRSFSDAVGKLSVLYKKHIAVEEKEVFPLASRVLPQPDLTAVGREMAIRRNVNLEVLRSLYL